MTALTRYQRLECFGWWREAPDAEAREVVVSFGDASLILSDIKTSLALTHWSLPALERLNPGDLPARYSPDPSAGETLEIDDDLMINAIEQVRRVIESQRPKEGRLRAPLIALLVGGLLIAAVLFLPTALTRHTAAAVPQATREAIGELVLRDMVRLTGPVCSTPNGDRALRKMWARLSDGRPGGISVVPNGSADAVHLPGGRILLRRSLLEDQDNEEVAAGHVLAEQVRADAADPLLPLLEHAGLLATFRLLTTGELPPTAVRGLADALLAAPVSDVDPKTLLSRFAAAKVPSTPYAQAIDPTNAHTEALRTGDPFRTAAAPPILTDTEWVGLQGICAR
ncbi:hypothetical protein CDV50_01915 [Haematobacter massiliensis]|uniref:Uncharacterized protein n=1 Tax=Haematobacter massiliensis TaxID=195105 RepID=A0A086YAM4_9RHOB|nr:hypothetical protein [Haematobacter massiliensis]KFI31324.1 hypothetical protein CN97_09885 [Haematobacter massiliensis]OWJ73636.1 hypothetical protein CDV50_01915 [Haematobacter massiliensis]OWJ87060.1 hypothetical protein CDV51_08695 [Haematobacter massiliensis]QBJ23395.1 hypothetical protein HmaOT1_03425 [Haematobacter massiliensis]